jgi:hypothetical protein
MKASILNKIHRELDYKIDTEPKVIYLFVEIRKFLDSCNSKTKNKYPNLYFFCDWVLHIQMDRSPTQEILKRFEKIVNGQKNIKDISKVFINREVDFYMFYDLKEELIYFLQENNLPYKKIKDNVDWPIFRKLLVEILKECPLVSEQGKVGSFAFEEGPDQQTRFRVKIKGKGGGSFKITLKEKYYSVG